MSTAFITLRDVKAHLRITNDDQDAYLQGLLEAAVSAAEGRIFRTLDDVASGNDGRLPASLRQWVLLAAGELDRQRELTDDRRFVPSVFVDSLLHPHIDTSKGF